MKQIVIIILIAFSSCIKNPKPPVVAPAQNILFQRDSIGWRIIQEQYGATKGEGLVKYSQYMDSTTLVKAWLTIMADKKKQIESKPWEQEWAQYDLLLRRLTSKSYGEFKIK